MKALLFFAIVLAFFALLGFVGVWLFKLSQLKAREKGKKILREDILKKLFSRGPLNPEELSTIIGSTPEEVRSTLGELEAEGLLKEEGGSLHLLEKGELEAVKIVRAHRVWEHYLAQRTGYPATEWHRLAEVKEHQLTAEELEDLHRSLGFPLYDPHGDPIPSQRGDFKSREVIPLLDSPKGRLLKVAHVEDEPEKLYRKIAEKKIFPGEKLLLIERDSEKVTISLVDVERELSLDEARNIFVEVLSESPPPNKLLPLSRIPLGQSAKIVELGPGIFGLERRRLFDLGLLPGTLIRPELTSPLGDPRAYRVRDNLLALRRSQAEQIRVVPLAKGEVEREGDDERTK